MGISDSFCTPAYLANRMPRNEKKGGGGSLALLNSIGRKGNIMIAIPPGGLRVKNNTAAPPPDPVLL